MDSRSARDFFDAALALPPAERSSFLEHECAEPGLRAQVESLLRAHDLAGTGFLGRSAIELTASPPPLIGRRIGHYELTSEIGRGGMGIVYLAVRADDTYRKAVAVKLVSSALAGDEGMRRFRRERQILAELDHPFIARLIDGGATDDGLPYFVMDYVDGMRIDEYCRARALDVRARLELFIKVCDAVQFAHAHLVVHRDLKPQNILVSADGTPRLLDFGVAALLASDGGAAVTITSVAGMTPQYASPEQMKGERVTTATDVYSLGVVLYELLAGRPPYELGGTSTPEAFRLVVERDPVRPSDVAPAAARRALRGDLDTIVMTALQKDARRRYASASALATDIRRHLDGLPVTARGDSVGYRTVKFVRRNRLGVAASAAVLATLVGGIVATSRQARIAVAERREAERQRARAERRFADVRHLANSFLFEFHDAIATLPGATPARQLVVAKALEYLDGLASESTGDVQLQRELAAAYDRVGDVQGNQSTANLGDITGALASYRKAQAIRAQLAAGDADDLATRLDAALSAMKIGDAEFGRGAIKDAVEQYRSALAPREEALQRGMPSAAVARERLVEVTGRLCTVLLGVGDVPGAIQSCERNRDLTAALMAAQPDNRAAKTMRATSSTALGNALRISGQPVAAEKALDDAIALYGELLAANGVNADLRRRLAVAHGYLANVYLDQKKPDASAASLARAIAEYDALASADPSNVRVRTELAYMLNRRAPLLVSLHQADLARREMGRALALLREATERSGAGGEAFNEYAWALVSCEPADLRRPAEALQLAGEALRRAGGPNPVYQHTQAWALYRLGRRGEAVAALEGALRQLAPGAGGPAVGLRRQMETDLAAFRAGE
ncbi:MAG TPA: protein kinase [Vicinamibacterales bacterium]|nr:protein kinase [Vicinamibacterales bacterium]